tara:strand:+ start:76 stop:666 length:591 start_codon:yes stop_codon:yes gene_type:complete
MASGLLGMVGKVGKNWKATKNLDIAGQASKATQSANPWYSKYSDEILIGGATAGAAGILGSQLIYEPINKRKYHTDKVLEIMGPEELEEWRQRPWDHENDPNFVNTTMNTLFKKSTDELDTFLVPRSVAKEAAADNVIAFLKYAQGKDGAPPIMGTREGKVVYGEWESKKDQFGHGTIQGQGPSMGNLEMQDVARY